MKDKHGTTIEVGDYVYLNKGRPTEKVLICDGFNSRGSMLYVGGRGCGYMSSLLTRMLDEEAMIYKLSN